MAKIAKKKQSSAENPRSRAAKRATSPSIDVDKSIKEISRAPGASPMLGVTIGSGVTKKRKVKHMTRGQRIRQEKGLARAEAVMDQMEKKVDSAKTKLKKRNMRKALWEDVNESTADEKRITARGPGIDIDVEAKQDLENGRVKDLDDIDMATTKDEDPARANPFALQKPQSFSPVDEGKVPDASHESEPDLIT